MTTENIQDQIIGIVTHENTKLKARFETVDQYVGYKSRALKIAHSIYASLQEPFVLKGFTEAISADSPYFVALHIKPFSNEFGKRIIKYSEQQAELTLDIAVYMSRGSLVWQKTVLEGTTVYFVYIEPENLDDNAKWVQQQLYITNNPPKEGEEEPVSTLN